MAAWLVMALVALPARAQQPAPTADTKAAEDHRTALYRDGVAAATAGRWTEARNRFREVLAIRTSPKVLFSLAQAEEQLGQVASAQDDYGRALEGARAAGEAEVVAAAAQAQRAIEPRVPHVRVVVSGASDAKATLDDRPIAVGTPVAVDPGAHHLVVGAPGMQDATTNVAIGEKQQLDVPVRMQAVGSPAVIQAVATPASPAPATSAVAPDTTPTSAGSAAPWRTIGLVAAGAGVVGLGIGAAFGLVAKSKDDQSNSSGCSGDSCTASAAAVRRDALSAANVSTVAFVVGGVLAAGGVVLWLVAPSGDATGGVSATPMALGSGGGVLVTAGW